MATAEPREDLTVVCVHWGNKYAGVYVHKLALAVRTNLSCPHRFVVLTEDPRRFPDLDTIESPRPLDRGWWQKILLFKPGLVPGTKALFLDLDSAILGPLDAVADFPVGRGDVVMVPPVPPVREKPPASPALLWRPGDGLADLWDLYASLGWEEANALWRGGVQRFITDTLGPRGRIRQFPVGWFPSYKGCALTTQTLGPEARVLVFHGVPKPLDLPTDDPFRQLWENPCSRQLASVSWPRSYS